MGVVGLPTVPGVVVSRTLGVRAAVVGQKFPTVVSKPDGGLELSAFEQPLWASHEKS